MRGVVIAASLLLPLLLVAVPARAYDETDHIDSTLSTHQFIMDKIPAIWEHDGHPELAALLRGGWLDDLKRGTVRADATLWDSRDHYMDPGTHTGLLFFTAAGDFADRQFRLAAAAWAAADRATALMHLGWAMHLVQDLTVPHHAHLTFLDAHFDYEAWVLANQGTLPVAVTGTYNLPRGPAGHYADSSRPFDWVDYAAHRSDDLFDLVDGADGTDGNDYRVVAAQMVPLAEQLSAGFLYQMLGRLNEAPKAHAGPGTMVRLGGSVTLDARGSTDDVGILGYEWSLPTGTVSGPRVAWMPAQVGDYTVSVSVTDVFGAVAASSTTVDVFPVPALDLPAIVAAEAGAPASVAAQLSDGEIPAAVEWTGPDWRETGVTLTRTFSLPGDTRVLVTVTLFDGLFVSGETVVQTADKTPPIARIQAAGSASVGDPIAFDAEASTDNVGIAAYLWRFGDGETAASPNATHAFASPGEYLVILEVTDGAGNRAYGTATVLVLVRPPAAAEQPIAALPLDVAALFLAFGVLVALIAAIHRHFLD